ncbi:MAG: hypothetical protein HC915_03100 [Anaerolineae bacterium]|nr:hypothetical protein [Anaerolineae bacterium]
MKIVRIHQGASTNNWQLIEVNLTNLPVYTEATRKATGPAPETISYRNLSFEVAFILESDASVQGLGWYIDDIRMEAEVFNVYRIPFVDDVEDAAAEHWVAEGNWGRGNNSSRSATIPGRIARTGAGIATIPIPRSP